MSDKKLFLKASLFSAMCAMLITVILCCIFAGVMLAVGLLPQDILSYAMVALLAAGSFFGGFIGARITKSLGMLTGMTTGFIIFLLVTITGVIKSNDSLTLLTLIRFAATLIAGGLGGIVGVNKKEKINIK